MDEDALVSILAATFRGTNDEVESAMKELNQFFNEPNFPSMLFSIIANKNHEIAIKQSASILISYIIRNSLIPPDLILSFCQNFAIVIESSESELFPLLKKCSHQLIRFLYAHSIDLSSIIFDLLSQNHFKSSLFFANSFMKIITNSSQISIEIFKSFTSNYIFSLQEIFQSLFSDSEEKFENEMKRDLVSLIFQFLAKSVSYLLPEIFNDHSQIDFWFPLSMESFDAIEYDEYHYIKFLSNWPKRSFQGKEDSDILSLINELVSWSSDRLGKYSESKEIEGFDMRLISMTFRIFYKLISFNLYEIEENFFKEILKTFILPSFNYDNLIEYNHPITKNCWNNLYDASLNLFIEIIEKDNQFSNIFYSLFESTEFIESELFISALDLYSLSNGTDSINIFYKIDPSQFFSFLNQLGPFIDASNDDSNIKIGFLKILSKLEKVKIKSSEFLLNSIYFSLSNIFNDDSLVRYFAALSSSSLISHIKENDVELKSQIFESTPIIEKMNDLFSIFFELERDYQTQMITESLKKIIFFFGDKIQPFLLQISNEVIELFFRFASNSENNEPSILLASILCKLIEIAEGDPQFSAFVLKYLLNEENISCIRYPIAFDKLFDMFTSLVYYSTEFLEDFCSIVPLLNAYLYNSNNSSHLFADFSNVVEMLIWKKSIINESDVEKVDAILSEFLMHFLQSCDYLDEWIIAASLGVKINSISSMCEISFIIPKLLSFLSDNPSINSTIRNLVYSVVEHSFSYHCTEILSNFSEAVYFLFNDIYIQNAKYPSFIDSFLKCFDSLPDELKSIAFQKARLLAENKSNDLDHDQEEEEEWYDEDDNESNLTPKWFDENEILENFKSFISNLES